MAYYEGSFTNPVDFFNTFNTRLLENGWVIENQKNINQLTVDTYFEIIYSSIARNNTKIFVGVKYFYSILQNKWVLRVRSMVSYTHATGLEFKPTQYSYQISGDILLNTYFLSVTPNCVKLHTYYNIYHQNLHFGLILPMCEPRQYPLPYYIGASLPINHDVTNVYNHLNSDQIYNSNYICFYTDGRVSSVDFQIGALFYNDVWTIINGRHLKIFTEFNSFNGISLTSVDANDTGYNLTRSFENVTDYTVLQNIYFIQDINLQPIQTIGIFDGVCMLMGSFNYFTELEIDNKKYKILPLNPDPVMCYAMLME